MLGYLSGWALIVSALIFMVIATFPAGGSVISIFTSSTPNKTLVTVTVTVIGAVSFMLMVGVVAAGVTVKVKVKVKVKAQIIMSTLEVALLVLFAGLALFDAHHVTSFSWH